MEWTSLIFPGIRGSNYLSSFLRSTRRSPAERSRALNTITNQHAVMYTHISPSIEQLQSLKGRLCVRQATLTHSFTIARQSCELHIAIAQFFRKVPKACWLMVSESFSPGQTHAIYYDLLSYPVGYFLPAQKWHFCSVGWGEFSSCHLCHWSRKASLFFSEKHIYQTIVAKWEGRLCLGGRGGRV